MAVTTDALPSLQASSRWGYIETGATRDLRIDFMRGIVFVFLFTAHFRYFSWFSLVAWERFGIVSSAETFILLAGVVTGAVYGKKLKAEGLGPVAILLFQRAWTLYKIAILVGGSIALLRLVPGLHTEALTTFTDELTGKTFPLYPPIDKPLLTFYHVIFLKTGPDQFQVIGLYVVLFLLTPFIFWFLYHRRTFWLLALSWAAWLVNFFTPEAEPGTAQIRLTGSQFEFAFPSMAWQLIFVQGVVIGFYKRQIQEFFRTRAGKGIVILCAVISVLLAIFSLNHPLPQLPDWAVLDFIPPDTFEFWYRGYFLKYNLGPGRLLNSFALMITVYALLTVAWQPINRALGWLFIPLGQESMYVFLVHIYLILIVANTPLGALQSPLLNTFLHAGVLLLTWFMIKTRFLFRWVPH